MKEKYHRESVEQEQILADLKKDYNKIQQLLEQKGYARKRRQNTPTTFETINDTTNSTRYKRRNETKNMLAYIHGGDQCAIFGAWDYISSHCNTQLMEKLILSFKRGKFLDKLYGKFTNVLQKSDSGMKKAIAMKYANHLSRRKYNFMCKIQKSTYDESKESWTNNAVVYGEAEINLRSGNISHHAVDTFVKGLDIGEIHQIAGYSGVTRTVTALITMIADINLKVKQQKENLIWFKNIINHFVVEFSDDGAPESREKTMTIGSLTLWNYGSRIRSREFHYPLHMISTTEKDIVCSDLWQQHADEMQLIESNVFTINEEKVTFEFQPSADQAWQFWAANVLTQSATYPSPYANVHKNDLRKIGGTIGHEYSNTWKPPTMNQRKVELQKLKEFEEKLSKTISAEVHHKKKLEFMADNGFRQLGEPRIGIFADRIRPEPLHLEINNWQHVLNIIYFEAVRRKRYKEFSNVVKSPITDTENPGCGLKFIGDRIDEHYMNESIRMIKIDVRLIGAQAIALAQFSFRLVDSLYITHENKAQVTKLLSLTKICQTLRDIGALINQTNVHPTYTHDLQSLCQLYFNLFSLFYPEQCQSTVWTLAYALPYHATLIYKEYGVGYGILSMQGKESKHSAIKQELKSETNRSIAQDYTGKWHQIMRSCFVRNFYLPYHFPISNSYHSHYQSRKPLFDSDINHCECSRIVQDAKDQCQTCLEAYEICSSAKAGKLSTDIMKALKPIECRECRERFADILLCDKHVFQNHTKNPVKDGKKIVPALLSVTQLKMELKDRKMSVSGGKEILRRRLEGALSSEL